MHKCKISKKREGEKVSVVTKSVTNLASSCWEKPQLIQFCKKKKKVHPDLGKLFCTDWWRNLNGFHHIFLYPCQTVVL